MPMHVYTQKDATTEKNEHLLGAIGAISQEIHQMTHAN